MVEKQNPRGMEHFIATENHSHAIQTNAFQYSGLVLNKDIHHKDTVMLSFMFYRTPCFWNRLVSSHHVRIMYL